MNSKYPLGTVTFLFTDIEGSTRLWEQGPQAMQLALARHDQIVKDAVASSGGAIVKTTGDGIHAAFATSREAAVAALAAQRALQSEQWPDSARLHVRMGVHTGEAQWREGDYYGTAVNRAARLMSIANGDQVLMSLAAAQLTRDSLPAEASLLDLGIHRLKDLERPIHVFELRHPALRAGFQPLRSLDAFPHNLPVQLNSFIGREQEISALRRLLDGAPAASGKSPARLVTLTGPGGTGKTRLALHLGAELLTTFSDGVWLVELASLADPTLVTQAVATALNLRETPDISILDLVTSYLRQRQLFLVLDNCEHLIDACARLADHLLAHCPRLTLLISSREALGIGGEVVFRVPSLALPGQARGTPTAAVDTESVRLFADRAAAVQPAFQLTEDNLPAVIEICARLDGVPLAIELAAARVRFFTPQQIAARLDDRFRLLTGGSRTALPRQQTLRALVDWSHDLLSESEKALFRQLAVFAGGWTFEAAEVVCADLDVLELLPFLLDKSLVVMEERDGEARYRYLETLRQYARDRLHEAGESTTLRDRHAAYFLERAENLEVLLSGPMQFEAMEECEAELDNLRAALEWGISRAPLSALRIAGALHFFWSRRGHHSEGLRWLKDALESTEKLVDQDVSPANIQLARAKATLAMSEAALRSGDSRQGLMLAQQAVALFRDVDNPGRLTYALAQVALYGWLREDPGISDEALAEAIALGQSGRSLGLAFAYGVRGTIAHLRSGDIEEARAAQEASRNLAHHFQDPWAEAQALMALGRIAGSQNQTDQARAYYREVLAIFERLRDRLMINIVMSELAHLERHAGNLDEALALYRQTMVIWHEFGMKGAIAHQLECLAYVARQRGDALRAARLLGAAEVLRISGGSTRMLPEQEEFEREIGALVTLLGDTELQSALEAGRQLSVDDAVASALAPYQLH